MKLSEKIYFYRKSLKLSQEELAERVGVSRQAVSKWELDEATPEVEKLLALARVFGITTDELLSPEEPEKAQPEPEQAAAPAPEPQFDRAMGFFGRLIRRFGWLAGVYVALAGAGVTLIGGLARLMFGRMQSVTENMFGGFGSSFGGGFGTVFPGGDMVGSVTAMSSVPVTIATVILVLGLCVMAAGIILAVVLYRKRGE